MNEYAVFFDMYYAKVIYGKMYPLDTEKTFLDEDNVYSYVRVSGYIITGCDQL